MNPGLYGILSTLAKPLPLLRGRRASPLMLPVYHLSTDHPAPHIQPLYPIRNTATFRADLDFFTQNYSPWHLSDLYQWLERDTAPDVPTGFHISFDDGLRQIYEEVAPILLEKGIPATFFINPDFVGNTKLFFRFKAGLLVDWVKKNTAKEGSIRAMSLHLSERALAAEALIHKILSIPYHQVAILDALGEIAALDFDAFLHAYRPYMSWEQIRSLQQQGFTIGAHSLDHPAYRLVSLEEQIRQTVGSLQRIREEVGGNIESFAFPFTDYGVSAAFFQHFWPSSEPIRSKSPLLMMGSAGLKTDTFPFHVQRLPMEGPSDDAATIVKSHFLYYWLKMPLGKNHIHRT